MASCIHIFILIAVASFTPSQAKIGKHERKLDPDKIHLLNKDDVLAILRGEYDPFEEEVDTHTMRKFFTKGLTTVVERGDLSEYLARKYCAVNYGLAAAAADAKKAMTVITLGFSQGYFLGSIETVAVSWILWDEVVQGSRWKKREDPVQI